MGSRNSKCCGIHANADVLNTEIALEIARKGCTKCCKILIDELHVAPNAQFNSRLLVESCLDGNFIFTELFLQADQSVDQEVHHIAVWTACMRENWRCAEHLLELQHAQSVGRDVKNYFHPCVNRKECPLTVRSDESPLVSACAREKLDSLVHWMVHQNADVNKVDPAKTPMGALWWACKNDNFETAQVLLQHGADPNLGHPIVTACEHGSIDMVLSLLEANANVDDHAKTLIFGPVDPGIISTIKNWRWDAVREKLKRWPFDLINCLFEFDNVFLLYEQKKKKARQKFESESILSFGGVGPMLDENQLAVNVE